MSNRLDRNPNRVSFDPQGADIPAFDEIAEERGMSRAELLREKVKETVGQREDETGLPEDETLRRAYLTLLDAAGENHRIQTEAAESTLAQELTRPSGTIRSVLKDLETRGYVAPRWGVLTVRRRDALVPVSSTTTGVAPADD
ncbi:hypothetical protein [Halobaculum magnesiiphilum]|uniref:Uncharacterized protein n=1 Tax=Halobaculum magnesiiphilum TaxID=1017351 RepID=A0A8T8WD27_9EURY|nr:hypothetical protein [Halobaculum magnesiiphilum]QZP37740.1 hypothetical protein K6T50_00740 [Halobaculum magnesiiphilum]